WSMVLSRLPGDPSMFFAIPLEQYRNHYDVFTPSTYDVSILTVIAPRTASVLVDGIPISSTLPVGTSGYLYFHHEVPAGAHDVCYDSDVGITVGGFAPYVSYAYPGGMDLSLLF